MANTARFSATIQEYELTREEAVQLKNQLFALRKQYIKQIWGSQLDIMPGSLNELETSISDLEHKLAHARIVA